MASEITRLSDIVIPEVFDNYVNEDIATKLNLLQSNAVTLDGRLSSFLAGAGNAVTIPMWKDCTNGTANVASDDPNVKIETRKIGARSIIVPRMVRTNAWASANLDEILIAEDPMAEITRQESIQRQRQIQSQILSTIGGVFANNALATDDYHTKDDMSLDISGTEYVAGATNFSGDALIDAISTMGDSQDELGLILVHSRIYAQMKKQQLIDVIPPASVGALPIYMYGGYRVIVNDLLPYTGSVFTTYILGADQIHLGLASVATPIAFEREELAGNGMGVTNMVTRYQDAIGVNGYSFVASVTGGGPSDASTSGNLANGNSWQRVATDRRNIKMVALVTRES